MARASISLFLVSLIISPSYELRATSLIKERDLALCLAFAGVLNYTTPSLERSNSATSSYYRLLNFSIQNLRFALPDTSKPASLILPDSLLHLRKAVLCCRAGNFSIRLRSGGHSYEGLSYLPEHPVSTSPFVLIDLMNLNRVRVDLESRTAWVESGATLGETYHAIAEVSRDLGFSAGSCPSVGSGGHIAGGGFGLLSRKYGLAADNVVDAVMVDSWGRVLDREAMGEVVFWAIRGGGGGGWGAIYAWQIRLVPVQERVTAFTVNRPGSTSFVAELVHKWQLVAPILQDEFYLSAFIGAALPESDRTGISATFKGFYLGPKTEAVSIMTQEFPELILSELDCHEMSWIESVVFFSGLPKGSTVSDLKDRVVRDKKSFKAKSDYVRSPITKSDLIGAVDLLSQEPKAYLILDPYGGAMSRISSHHLPFPHRSGNLYAIQYLIEWTSVGKEENEKYMAWMRLFYKHMENLVSRAPRRAYVNYLDLDLGSNGWTSDMNGEYEDSASKAREWGEKYFLENYDRLVRAKTAIDPENVFNNAQSIPPLLSGTGLEKNWDDDDHDHDRISMPVHII